MTIREATQEEIDFVFGAIDWKHEGFPTNYDGSVEIEVDITDLIDLIWNDHHNAERVDILLLDLYDKGDIVWEKFPFWLIGTYRITPEDVRSFEVWEMST